MRPTENLAKFTSWESIICYVFFTVSFVSIVLIICDIPRLVKITIIGYTISWGL